MFRKSRFSMPGRMKVPPTPFPASTQVVAQGPVALCDADELEDIDDGEVADVSIGLPGSAGCLVRVLQRLRATLREAIRSASEQAERLARDADEVILTPGRRPSAIHVVDGEAGWTLWLDYDLGPLGQLHRPGALRGLRILITARRGVAVGRGAGLQAAVPVGEAQRAPGPVSVSAAASATSSPAGLTAGLPARLPARLDVQAPQLGRAASRAPSFEDDPSN